MSCSISKIVFAFFVATAAVMVNTADAAPVKRHGAHPVKKARAAVDAPKPEKLVRAPGGVMVPKQATAGRNPGFMDDGASKRGDKP
ncbi:MULTISPECIES: hypothetical protein [unclassified Variovorax]|jgi:hypothetical protein|uniref:hypothetical protein n=1 Tax=unclassified Variovorax TaxID=663243 RepID=UPI002B233FDA|nr:MULTISPECIES: hypothetical protein [unclassified Variovorax]MEB0056176.1 hypothetical protein [Variovorax sp. LG9.2]MEB0110090.1 hypothetical protein [Variovorax sp. RTB1]